MLKQQLDIERNRCRAAETNLSKASDEWEKQKFAHERVGVDILQVYTPNKIAGTESRNTGGKDCNAGRNRQLETRTSVSDMIILAW